MTHCQMIGSVKYIFTVAQAQSLDNAGKCNLNTKSNKKKYRLQPTVFNVLCLNDIVFKI